MNGLNGGRGQEDGCAVDPEPGSQREGAGPAATVLEHDDVLPARLLAIVDKRRPRAGVSEVMNIIGDVSGQSCILIDDIVDSGGTLVNAAEALLKAGAKAVSAYITHGVLSEGASERIGSSKLKELVVTDSIAETDAHRAAGNIRRMTIAPLIGEAVARTASEQSVSSLFD